MNSSPVSEEELNAFVDGQLNTADHARVLQALSHDETLQMRVAEIQQTRSLLRHAYEQVPLPPQARMLAPQWQQQVIAASLLVTLSFAGGWFLHNFSGSRPRPRAW